MRRGILSSLPDDDYLSIALLHCTFNVYATICRATDRQGFLNVRNSWVSAANDKVSTDFGGFGERFCIARVPLGVGAFRRLIPLDSRSRPMWCVLFLLRPSSNLQCIPCLLSA